MCLALFSTLYMLLRRISYIVIPTLATYLGVGNVRDKIVWIRNKFLL